MGLIELGLLLTALSFYSMWNVGRLTYVHHRFMPFLDRIHSKQSLSLITDQEHQYVHIRYEDFAFKSSLVLYSAAIAVLAALFMFALVFYKGDPGWIGYVMAVTFAYVCAHYNLAAKTERWMEECESELLARVMVKHAGEAGFDSFADYLMAENEKMTKDWLDEVTQAGEEFESRLAELGFDDSRDYTETPELEAELVKMLEQVTNEMNEKYPERPEV